MPRNLFVCGWDYFWWNSFVSKWIQLRLWKTLLTLRSIWTQDSISLRAVVLKMFLGEFSEMCAVPWRSIFREIFGGVWYSESTKYQANSSRHFWFRRILAYFCSVIQGVIFEIDDFWLIFAVRFKIYEISSRFKLSFLISSIFGLFLPWY